MRRGKTPAISIEALTTEVPQFDMAKKTGYPELKVEQFCPGDKYTLASRLPVTDTNCVRDPHKN